MKLAAVVFFTLFVAISGKEISTEHHRDARSLIPLEVALASASDVLSPTDPGSTAAYAKLSTVSYPMSASKCATCSDCTLLLAKGGNAETCFGYNKDLSASSDRRCRKYNVTHGVHALRGIGGRFNFYAGIEDASKKGYLTVGTTEFRCKTILKPSEEAAWSRGVAEEDILELTTTAYGLSYKAFAVVRKVVGDLTIKSDSAIGIDCHSR